MDITFDTTFGRMTLEEEDHTVSRLYFAGQAPNYSTSTRPTLFLRQAAWEIREYLEGRTRELYVPTRVSATYAMRMILERIKHIRYGEVVTLRDVVARMPFRATHATVASVCRLNPIPILIPTHRVLGIYTGCRTPAAEDAALCRKLLALENALQSRN